MHDNNVERRAAGRRHVENTLQFRAAVIGAAGTRFDKFARYLLIAVGAVCQRLPTLVRDRQVIFSLPAHARANRGPRAKARHRLRRLPAEKRFAFVVHRTSSIPTVF